MKSYGPLPCFPRGLLVGLSIGAWAVAPSAWAETSVPKAELKVELNAVQDIDSGCRFTFVAENQMAGDLASLVFETVLFTSDGGVDRLTLFDFQALPQGKKRVRQFDIAGPKCASLGSVLINGIHACSSQDGAAQITPVSCGAALITSSRTGHEVLE